MRNILLAVSLVLIVPALDAAAADDTIKVEPGNYTITTKTRSNFSPNPQIETYDECLDKTSEGVKDFMPDDDACTASNVKKSGNKLTFDMKCTGTQAMPAMTGKAEISATSTTVKSHYKMVGSYQGQEFSIDSESVGQNNGPCKK